MSNGLEARIRRLEDIHEIGQLRARYCHYLDDGRWDELAELTRPISRPAATPTRSRVSPMAGGCSPSARRPSSSGPTGRRLEAGADGLAARRRRHRRQLPTGLSDVRPPCVDGRSLSVWRFKLGPLL